MAVSEFLLSSDINRYYFSHYTQGSVASFATAFNADWAATLGATIPVVATAGTPTVALIIISANQVLTVNPGDWVGFNGVTGWEVVSDSLMSGTKYTPSTV